VAMDAYSRLKIALPNVELVQLIHVVDESCLPLVQKVSEFVDAILLDSGNLQAKIKELGGTGRNHN